MTERLAFTVPGIPRGKARPRSVGRVVYMNGKPRAIVTVYSDPDMERLEAEIRAAFRKRHPDHRPWAAPVMLQFTAIFPIPAGWNKAQKAAALTGRLYHTSTPDKDNVEKLIVDALNRHAFADDAQVQGGGVKRYGEPPRLEIVLTRLDSPDLPLTPAHKAAEARVAAGPIAKPPAGRKSNQLKAGTDTPLGRAIGAALAKDKRQ